MGILDRARRDAQRFSSDTNRGFAVTATLTAKTGEVAEIKCLHSKHNISVGTDGQPVNSKNAHFSVHEQTLIEANPAYPIRDGSREVIIKGDTIEVADSTGNVWKYLIRESWPDETLGLLVFALGDYGDN